MKEKEVLANTMSRFVHDSVWIQQTHLLAIVIDGVHMPRITMLLLIIIFFPLFFLQKPSNVIVFNTSVDILVPWGNETLLSSRVVLSTHAARCM